MEIIIAIASLLAGTIALTAMFYGGLSRRCKKLGKRLKKHDEADKRLRKELVAARTDTATLREDTEVSFNALGNKIDQALLRSQQA